MTREVDGREFGDTTSPAIGEDGSAWVSYRDGLARYGEMVPVSNG
jgi:hypothetical protein